MIAGIMTSESKMQNSIADLCSRHPDISPCAKVHSLYEQLAKSLESTGLTISSLASACQKQVQPNLSEACSKAKELGVAYPTLMHQLSSGIVALATTEAKSVSVSALCQNEPSSKYCSGIARLARSLANDAELKLVSHRELTDLCSKRPELKMCSSLKYLAKITRQPGFYSAACKRLDNKDSEVCAGISFANMFVERNSEKSVRMRNRELLCDYSQFSFCDNSKHRISLANLSGYELNKICELDSRATVCKAMSTGYTAQLAKTNQCSSDHPLNASVCTTAALAHLQIHSFNGKRKLSLAYVKNNCGLFRSKSKGQCTMANMEALARVTALDQHTLLSVCRLNTDLAMCSKSNMQLPLRVAS